MSLKNKEYRVRIYVLSALTICLVFGLNPSVFTALTALYLIFVINREVRASAFIKNEIKFLKAFNRFLGIMRHYYYKTGSIVDALVISETDADPVIKDHVREMAACLSSSDTVSKVDFFMNSDNHRYFKLFMTLAHLVSENGDVYDENGSVFLNSCMHLKTDIEEDSRFIIEKKQRFSGLVLTIVLPVLAIPYIAMWAVSSIPTLNVFYNGYTGVFLRLLLLLISYLCYCAVYNIKGNNGQKKKKYIIASFLSDNALFERIPSFLIGINPGKTERIKLCIKRLSESYGIKAFYMHKVLLFVVFYGISITVFAAGHNASRNIYKYDSAEIQDIIMSADARQISAMEELIPQYTVYLIENRAERTKEELVIMLLDEKEIKSSEVAETAADEILRRIESYKNEVLEIRDVLIAFLIAIAAYNYPNISLFFKKSFMDSREMDEVMQFESIIHMLKKVPGVSIVSLLEEMERFSEIFRPSIKQCLDEYNISDEAALNRMYESERNPEFRKVIDCFLMADELGIEDAFEEISTDIENFRENRKLDRKLLLESEGMLGAVIAVVPGGLILFGYLLGPFMIRSLQIFNEYQSGLVMGT